MLEIRKARTGEAEAILEMYNKIIDDTEGKEASPRWTKGVYPDQACVSGAIEREEMYVAMVDGKPAGALIRNHVMAPGYEEIEWSLDIPAEEVFVIHTLGISPDFQHQSIASGLISAVVDEGRKTGVKAIRIDVIEGNYPAVRLFGKNGFSNHGKHVLHYDGMAETEFTLMELVLSVH